MPLIATAMACIACNGGPRDGGVPGDGDLQDSEVVDSDLVDAPVEPCPPEMVLVDDGEGAPFCIDRFEHPGQEGQAPTVGVAWYNARVECSDDGKSICHEEQWERACVGTPTDECTGQIGVSGRRSGCVSEFGVHDLAGNVGEWTATPGGSVSFMVRGGSGEGVEVGCHVSEEVDAEIPRVDVGLRCCKRPRR